MAGINPYSTGTPYFSKQVFLDTSNTVRRIVIQTAAPLVLAQGKDYDSYLHLGGTGDVFQIPEDGHLEVYADDLSLYGAVKLPGRNVTLVARTLKCLKRLAGDTGPGSLPAIDVSGADGPAPQFPDGLGPGSPAKDDPENLRGKIAFGVQGVPGQANRIYPIPGTHDVDTPGGTGPGRRGGIAFDPVWDGEPGDDGAPGQHAGSITIVAGTISQVPPARFVPFIEAVGHGENFLLTLTANGGKGGDGARGQAGGWAGSGGFGASHRSGIGAMSLGYTRTTDGGRGGDGGNGGKGGSGGPGGNGGAISVLAHHDHVPIWVTAMSKPGAPGAPGPGGYFGHKGAGGTGGTGTGAVTALYSATAQVEDGHHGADGNDGQPGAVGDPGAYGSAPAPKTDLTVSEDAIAQRLGQLARIDQLQMMVERARAAYLSVDIGNLKQETWKSIGDTLRGIRGMLINFPTTRFDGTSCQDDHDLAQRLKDIVDAMLVNHENQCDYFGGSRLLAPTLSLSAYDGALTKTLKCLAAVEQKRQTVLTQLAANEVALAEASDGQHEAEAASAYLKQKLSDTTTSRRQTQRELETATNNLETSRTPVGQALQTFETQVLNSFGLSTSQLLNALTQVAFTGLPIENKASDPGGGGGGFGLSPVHAVNSAIMGGLQLASTIDSGTQNVLNDGGDPVNKQFVVKQVRNAGEVLKTALSTWNADGSITVNNDGMNQLACRREQFDDLVKDFSQTPGAKMAKSLLDGYVDDVDARNKLIANYNALLMREYALLGEIQKSDLQKRQFETKMSRNQNPGLAHVGMWMSNLYEVLKASCLDELYMEHRAEAFWATKPYSGIGSLFPGARIEVIDHDTIATAQTQISGNILSHLKEALTTKSRFPLSQDLNATGVVVAITPETHPSVFDDLRSSDVKQRGDATSRPSIKVHFDLPVATSTSDVTNAFHGKADVRLTNVRPYLIGLKTGSDHTVTITHSGTEYIQSQGNEQIKFVHDPRPIPFSYTPDPAWTASSNAVHPSLGSGSQVAVLPDWRSLVANAIIRAGGELDLPKQSNEGVLVNAAYAPIGPFTRWNLTIRYTDYEDLDLSELSAIVIDFHGFFRAFN